MSRRLLIIVPSRLAILVALLATCSAWAVEPGAKPLQLRYHVARPIDFAEQQARRLVRRLGDDSFDVREAASHDLLRIGAPAKEALLEGLQSDDAEIRSRCRRLLGVVLDLDHEARIEAFALDTEGRHDHDLPGWDRYRRLVGNDRTARDLFVEMQRAEPHLLEAVEANPDDIEGFFSSRCEAIQQVLFKPDARARQPVAVGSIAALFFVASHPNLPMSDQIVSWLHSFSYQPAFVHSMTPHSQNSGFVEPMRKIVGAWVGRDCSAVNYQNFLMALRYDLPEALEPALATLRDKDNKPFVSFHALLIVGRFGSEEHVALLQPLLEDESVCGTYQVGGRESFVQVRDLALAVALHLTSQDHRDYGFEGLRRSPRTLFVPTTVGFVSDEQRTAAIEKWHAWSQAGNLSSSDLQ